MNIPMQFLKQQLDDANVLIREQIISLLHDRNFSAFKNVEVLAADGAITLRGNVRSFYHKQIALTHSQRVAGSYPLIDEVVVDNNF